MAGEVTTGAPAAGSAGKGGGGTASSGVFGGSPSSLGTLLSSMGYGPGYGAGRFLGTGGPATSLLGPQRPMAYPIASGPTPQASQVGSQGNFVRDWIASQIQQQVQQQATQQIQDYVLQQQQRFDTPQYTFGIG